MRSEALLTMMLAGLLLTSCDAFQRTTIEDSAVRTHPEASQDFEFWDALAKQSVVTNNDALHGLLLLANGEDPCENYDCRYEAGVAQGWFEGTWGGQPPADASAKVGWMAVAGCTNPAEQGRHSGEASGAYRPGEHSSHFVPSALGALPGLHASQPGLGRSAT